MSDKVITVISKEEKEELTLECFRIELHHEYKINGKRVKIDEPLSVQCVMPLGDGFGLPRYSKREIVMMLSEKLTGNMRGEE